MAIRLGGYSLSQSLAPNGLGGSTHGYGTGDQSLTRRVSRRQAMRRRGGACVDHSRRPRGCRIRRTASFRSTPSMTLGRGGEMGSDRSYRLAARSAPQRFGPGRSSPPAGRHTSTTADSACRTDRGRSQAYRIYPPSRFRACAQNRACGPWSDRRIAASGSCACCTTPAETSAWSSHRRNIPGQRHFRYSHIKCSGGVYNAFTRFYGTYSRSPRRRSSGPRRPCRPRSAPPRYPGSPPPSRPPTAPGTPPAGCSPR